MIPGLVLRELGHRPVTALLAVLVLASAVAAPLAIDAGLRTHARQTEERARTRGEEAGERMRRIERDLRRITLGMGYNAVVVAPGQDLDRLRLDGIPDTDLAQADGEALAAARPDTLNHLLPVLMRRLRWPERQSDIVLAGAGGETWIADPRTQAPLLQRLPADGCVPAKALAERLGLKVGDAVTLAGRRLTVAGVRGARGGLEDAMLWVDLGLAQELLAAPGRINAIYGLLCRCDDDAGAAAQAQVRRVLPGHQVAVFATAAKARGEMLGLARNAAAEAAEAERTAAERERAALAGLGRRVVVAALLAAALVVAATAWANAQARRAELAVLRAVGWSAGRVLLLVLGRQAAVGIAGAGLGLGAAMALAGGPPPPFQLATVAVAAPLLAMLASLPSIAAAVRSEPAALLRDL